MSDHEPPAADLSKMIWFYPEWIEALGPLNEKNALAYFQQSPYYDKQCSNEILKMQRMHTIQGQEEGDEEEDLKKFTGVEFALVHARSPPSLFIIHKRERFSPTEASPIAAYFIVNDSIYQAQDLHSLLSSRLTVAVTSIQSSLQLLHSTLTTASPFNPRSESQFVLSKTTTPTLLPASEPQQPTNASVDSPAPGGPSTPSANPTSSSSQPKRTTTSQPDSNPTQSQSLLLSLRTTLSSLPSLLASSSTAPPAPPPSNPNTHGSLGGRTPSYIGGGTPSAGTPSFLNSYTDSRRNTPASTGGPGGMVPTPPNSSKNGNRGSPEEGGGGGGGGGKKKRRKTATAQGAGGGSGPGGGQGGSQAGTPVGGS